MLLHPVVHLFLFLLIFSRKTRRTASSQPATAFAICVRSAAGSKICSACHCFLLSPTLSHYPTASPAR